MIAMIAIMGDDVKNSIKSRIRDKAISVPPTRVCFVLKDQLYKLQQNPLSINLSSDLSIFEISFFATTVSSPMPANGEVMVSVNHVKQPLRLFASSPLRLIVCWGLH